MNDKIFMSYSWKDMRIAVKIYSDLVRNGCILWRDAYSVSYGKDFNKEIGQALQECKGVILFDSSNSRYSKYVRDEWRLLNQNDDWKNGAKQISICLVGDKTVTHSAPELFENHNSFRYFDFSISNLTNLYDNDRTYHLGISGLCKFWDVKYQSLYPECTQKDFEEELSKFNLQDIDKSILLREFDVMQTRFEQKFPGTTERLGLFIKECEHLEIYCPTLTLQLGAEYAKAGLNSKAKSILLNYTDTYNNDPRGWRLLASVLYDVKDFEGALSAYDKTVRITEAIEGDKVSKKKSGNLFNSEKNMEFLPLTKLNRISTYLQLNQLSSATEECKNLMSNQKHMTEFLPQHFLVFNEILDTLNMKKEQRECLDKALLKFPGDFYLNHAMTKLYFVENNLESTLACFDRLINREIFDLEICAEYLSILKGHAMNTKFEDVLNKTLDYIPSSELELYHYGYILFLKGDIKKAEQYYQRSNNTLLPKYREIWKN